MNIVLKGRIIPTQNTVGNVLTVPKSVDGNINSQKQIGGIVSTQTQRLSGIIKNPSHVHGIISKPSYEHGKNDHVFVIVDLLQMHEQRIIYHNANVVVSLTAQSSQPVSKQIDISAVPVVVAVNSVTAGYASFSNNSITVQSAIAIKEEVNE